jgi:multidrug efflux pump subunit AcrA (membrane-fusion protein)
LLFVERFFVPFFFRRITDIMTTGAAFEAAVGAVAPAELAGRVKMALIQAETTAATAKRKMAAARDDLAHEQAAAEQAQKQATAVSARLAEMERNVCGACGVFRLCYCLKFTNGVFAQQMRALCGDQADIRAALESARVEAEAAEEKKYMAKALDDLYQTFKTHADKKHACRMCQRALASEAEASALYAEVERVKAETPAQVSWVVLLVLERCDCNSTILLQLARYARVATEARARFNTLQVDFYSYLSLQ